jgi:hypothetical protein
MAVPVYRSFPSHTSGAAAAAADADDELDGRDEREPVTNAPTVEAAFAAQSYRAGSTAKLVLFDSAPRIRLQLFRVGAIRGMLRARDRMRGLPVGPAIDLDAVSPGRTVSIQLGPWPSALYFATLTAPGGRIGYAPFVLVPRRLGGHKVAVVLPTETWQAYNFRDDDHNGTSDTWYAGGGTCTARLARPFENRGVPPHYRYYDEPFLRWLAIHDVRVDFISDAELNTASGAKLARSYNLLIFSGHHEYVTKAEYDAVTQFRDLGGNLMFLSANNFFWMITINNGTMMRIEQWRDLGRPEASLIGVQYYANDLGQHRASWTVKASCAGKWIFAGTGLTAGSQLSSGGIEADDVQLASPRNVQVLAQIQNLFGDGRNAQMTYYTTPAGAKVFAAGAFSLAGSVWQPPVTRMMENLLAVLSKP